MKKSAYTPTVYPGRHASTPRPADGRGKHLHTLWPGLDATPADAEGFRPLYPAQALRIEEAPGLLLMELEGQAEANSTAPPTLLLRLIHQGGAATLVLSAGLASGSYFYLRIPIPITGEPLFDMATVIGTASGPEPSGWVQIFWQGQGITLWRAEAGYQARVVA